MDVLNGCELAQECIALQNRHTGVVTGTLDPEHDPVGQWYAPGERFTHIAVLGHRGIISVWAKFAER